MTGYSCSRGMDNDLESSYYEYDYDCDDDDYYDDISEDPVPLAVTEKNCSYEHSKKKSIGVLAVISVLVLGVCLSAFLVLFNNITEQQPVIVRLSEVEASSLKKQSIDKSVIVTKELSSNVTSNNNDIASKEATGGYGQKAKHNILIPMPDSLVYDENITVVPSKEQAFGVDIEQNITNDAKHLSLVEDELLSKTDVPFDFIQNDYDSSQPLTIAETNRNFYTDTVLEADLELVDMQVVDKKEPNAAGIVRNHINSEKADNSYFIDRFLEVRKPVAPQRKEALWVIKAAQPRAAVIYDINSKETKSVEINDFVNGIGQIKAIKKIEGSWVIVGASGKIRQ